MREQPSQMHLLGTAIPASSSAKAELTAVHRPVGWHIHLIDCQADEVTVQRVTPAVLAAALHEGSHHLEGQTLQVGPHHMAAVGDQVCEAAQHCTPYLWAPFFPLLTGKSWLWSSPWDAVMPRVTEKVCERPLSSSAAQLPSSSKLMSRWELNQPLMLHQAHTQISKMVLLKSSLQGHI